MTLAKPTTVSPGILLTLFPWERLQRWNRSLELPAATFVGGTPENETNAGEKRTKKQRNRPRTLRKNLSVAASQIHP